MSSLPFWPSWLEVPSLVLLLLSDHLSECFDRLGIKMLALEEIPVEGLFEVRACRSAGITIRRHVLDAIGDPWFSYRDGQYLNEDLVLCEKIREAGFKIWCDPSARMGHRATYTVWPVFDDEGWGIGMNMGQAKEDGKPQRLTIRPREHGRKET